MSLLLIFNMSKNPPKIRKWPEHMWYFDYMCAQINERDHLCSSLKYPNHHCGSCESKLLGNSVSLNSPWSIHRWLRFSLFLKTCSLSRFRILTSNQVYLMELNISNKWIGVKQKYYLTIQIKETKVRIKGFEMKVSVKHGFFFVEKYRHGPLLLPYVTRP